MPMVFAYRVFRPAYYATHNSYQAHANLRRYTAATTIGT